jgi:hypothetical protein
MFFAGNKGLSWRAKTRLTDFPGVNGNFFGEIPGKNGFGIESEEGQAMAFVRELAS